MIRLALRNDTNDKLHRALHATLASFVTATKIPVLVRSQNGLTLYLENRVIADATREEVRQIKAGK